MEGTYSNWVKIISTNTASVKDIDSSSEVFGQFNTNNALIFDNESKVLYFLDAETNGGIAQQISASTEYPLYIVKGDGSILSYNGSASLTINTDTIHKTYSTDPESLKTLYQNGVLKCPLLEVDSAGHIKGTQYVNLTLAGDDDASLVTVAKTAILFAQYATKFQIEACGKGTLVGYELPNPENIGKSYKCVDAHEYYYQGRTKLITYEDEEGVTKNPGAGDIIICSQIHPEVKWSVIVNKYELYTDTITGLVPAYGDASTGILFAKAGWGYLNGNKGIKIVNNKTIEHINDISSGTAGQQYDQEGHPTDDLFIPHSVTSATADPNFVISIPKITYDEEGHIAEIKDSSVTIEVSKIIGGDFPSLTTKYIDSALESKTVVYDPNSSDTTLNLENIRAKNAVDSSKVSGCNVTTNAADIFNGSIAVVTTAYAVNEYVKTYVESHIDSSLSTISENAIQNKVVYNEILRRDSCVYEKIQEEHIWVDTSLSFKADKFNVIEKDSSIEYVPTEEYHPTNKKYVDIADTSLRNSKQNKLKPGPGVILVDDSVGGTSISFSADMFIVIDGYVVKKTSDDYTDDISIKISDPSYNKVYIWRLYDPSEGQTSTPIYIEFSYDFNRKKWVQLGRFRLDFLIDNRLKEIDTSIKELQEEHVFLTENEWEIIKPFQNPDKIYFTYESEGPVGDISANVVGSTLNLSGSGVSVEDDVLYLIGDVSVVGTTLIF